MTKPWIERLHGIELFSQCTDKELEQIDALMTEVRIPEGKVLMREGDIGLEAFVIQSGEAVVSRDGAELARRGPGTIVGEMALIEHGPRTATVTAATPLTAYVLNRGEFSSLLADAPDVAAKITSEIESRRNSVHAT
jgi:CRP/FNR family transcriptional regulator, cyclic AMP receptor protein